MPNYVINNVTLHGTPERLKKFMDLMTTAETCFDFNMLIPMPEDLNMTEGSISDLAIRCAEARKAGKTIPMEPWAELSFEEYADLGDKYIRNKAKYGFTSWYGWCNYNWGTKWNAVEPHWENDNTVHFETAWSAPIPIYEKMSQMFPDIEFEVEYADEDLGSNCGTISWSEDSAFYWEALDDFDFACRVWGYDPEEMREEYAEA